MDTQIDFLNKEYETLLHKQNLLDEMQEYLNEESMLIALIIKDNRDKYNKLVSKENESTI